MASGSNLLFFFVKNPSRQMKANPAVLQRTNYCMYKVNCPITDRFD